MPSDTYSTQKPSAPNYALYAVIAVILVCAIGYFTLVKPALSGYAVYSQLKDSSISVDDVRNNFSSLRFELATVQANASACAGYSAQITSVLVAMNDTLETLSSRVVDQATQYTSLKAECDNNAQDLEQNAADAQTNLKNMQTSYNMLAANSARTICCKARVDDPSISAYTIADNKIICGVDGDQKLTC